MSNHDQSTDPKPLTDLTTLCESTGVEKAYVDVESLRDLLDERDELSRKAGVYASRCGRMRGTLQAIAEFDGSQFDDPREALERVTGLAAGILEACDD